MLDVIVRLWASTRLRPESDPVLGDKAASGTQDLSRVSAGAGASWGLGAHTLPTCSFLVGESCLWVGPALVLGRE